MKIEGIFISIVRINVDTIYIDSSFCYYNNRSTNVLLMWNNILISIIGQEHRYFCSEGRNGMHCAAPC